MERRASLVKSWWCARPGKSQARRWFLAMHASAAAPRGGPAPQARMVDVTTEAFVSTHNIGSKAVLRNINDPTKAMGVEAPSNNAPVSVYFGNLDGADVMPMSVRLAEGRQLSNASYDDDSRGGPGGAKRQVAKHDTATSANHKQQEQQGQGQQQQQEQGQGQQQQQELEQEQEQQEQGQGQQQQGQEEEENMREKQRQAQRESKERCALEQRRISNLKPLWELDWDRRVGRVGVGRFGVESRLAKSSTVADGSIVLGLEGAERISHWPQNIRAITAARNCLRPRRTPFSNFSRVPPPPRLPIDF